MRYRKNIIYRCILQTGMSCCMDFCVRNLHNYVFFRRCPKRLCLSTIQGVYFQFLMQAFKKINRKKKQYNKTTNRTYAKIKILPPPPFHNQTNRQCFTFLDSNHFLSMYVSVACISNSILSHWIHQFYRFAILIALQRITKCS